MTELIHYLLVAAGGGLGATARGFLSNRIDSEFPWATLVVNVVGSFLIGLIFAILANSPLQIHGKHFLADGFCGGFTTFSSFNLQTMELFGKGKFWHGLANVIVSILFCLIAVFAGIQLGQYLIR